jgi:hypothetical protein
VRKLYLGAALACALLLAVSGAALAVSAQDTTMDVTAKASPAKAGTKKKPRNVRVSLGIEGGTKNGAVRPETSTRIRVQLPKEFRWNGAKWPKSARCSVAEANQRQSASACPRASKVGSGDVVALAGNGNPPLREDLKISAHVTTTNDLGLFLTATVPVPINVMIVGEVKGNTIDVKIPTNVQEPVPGVATGIQTLAFSLTGKRGKTGIVTSTGCKRQWTTKVTNFLRGGQLSETVKQKCRK